MKEIPILFSTPMVQAILAGRKTQTRRIIKPQPDGELFSVGMGYYSEFFENLKAPYTKCRYGQPGDLLWVRETIWVNPGGTYHRYLNEVGDPVNMKNGGWKKKPSIHMPKDAARIWLEITNVRVERLQDISEADAIAEGVEFATEGDYRFFKDYTGSKLKTSTAKESFKTLWITIYGEKSWDANPWVWVVEFKVISTTGGKPCPR